MIRLGLGRFGVGCGIRGGVDARVGFPTGHREVAPGPPYPLIVGADLGSETETAKKRASQIPSKTNQELGTTHRNRMRKKKKKHRTQKHPPEPQRAVVACFFLLTAPPASLLFAVAAPADGSRVYSGTSCSCCSISATTWASYGASASVVWCRDDNSTSPLLCSSPKLYAIADAIMEAGSEPGT